MTEPQQFKQDKAVYPQYTVNGFKMRDYADAILYWNIYGGVLIEKLDAMTPAYVLRSDHDIS